MGLKRSGGEKKKEGNFTRLKETKKTGKSNIMLYDSSVDPGSKRKKKICIQNIIGTTGEIK
jgi:hypothetical protein